MKWSFYAFREVPVEIVQIWQSMNCRFAGDHPALDQDFIRPLSEFFGNGDELVGIGECGGKYIAGIVVEPEGNGVWSAQVPGQGCLAPLIFSPDVDIKLLMSSLLKSLPGFCWLLRLPQMDPDFQRTDAVVSECVVDFESFGTTYRVNLQQDFEKYWASRSKKLRYNMRKLFRDIEQQGEKVRLRIIENADEVSEGLIAHGSMESKGWKGAAGTAIHIDNRQGRFYMDLLDRFAREDGVMIAQLLFDNSPVASLLCILKNSMLIVLKTTYDESLSALAPGRVIDYMLLEECCSRPSLKVAEMYTRASRADLGWASETREIVDVNVYRNAFFGLIARLRRNAKESLAKAFGQSSAKI